MRKAPPWHGKCTQAQTELTVARTCLMVAVASRTISLLPAVCRLPCVGHSRCRCDNKRGAGPDAS